MKKIVIHNTMQTPCTLFAATLLFLGNCNGDEKVKSLVPYEEYEEWMAKYPEFPDKPKPPSGKIPFPAAQHVEQDTNSIDFITFHYAWVDPAAETPEAEREALGSGVANTHIPLGWKEVAYHYLIGNSGTVYKGRPDSIAPASSTYYFPRSFFNPNGGNYINFKEKNDNWKMHRGRISDLRYRWDKEKQKQVFTDKYLVELAKAKEEWKKEKGRHPATDKEIRRAISPGKTSGHLTICFLVKNQCPSEVAFKKAALLAAVLLDRYSLTMNDIRVHREVSTSTNCPGPYVFQWLRDKDPTTEKMNTNHFDRGFAYVQIQAVYEKIKDGKKVTITDVPNFPYKLVSDRVWPVQ